jgi:hypothetical protein
MLYLTTGHKSERQFIAKRNYRLFRMVLSSSLLYSNCLEITHMPRKCPATEVVYLSAHGLVIEILYSKQAWPKGKPYSAPLTAVGSETTQPA